MAKPIRFPLEMANGVKVRTMEELREHFDLMKVLGYYLDGKLLVWLNDRYYEAEVAQISELKNDLPDFKARLCTILGVKSNLENEIDMEAFERRSAKIAKIKRLTDDEEIINKVDSVAFDQEELSVLLDSGNREIFLAKNQFAVPVNKENITYIGIANPTVKISSNVDVDLDEKNIKFTDVYISATSKISIASKVIKKEQLDLNQIKLKKQFTTFIKAFEAENFNKILIYKDLIICAELRMYSTSYERSALKIIDIKTGNVLKTLNDLRPHFKGMMVNYLRLGISILAIRDNKLIIYIGEWPGGNNAKLMIMNLDTLDVELVKEAPNGHAYVYTPNFMNVNDNRICLYEKLALELKCQYHEYPSCKLIDAISVKIDDGHSRALSYSTFYQGNIYNFLPNSARMVSDKRDYCCEGFDKTEKAPVSFWSGNGNKGGIGKFTVFNNKIATTSCKNISGNTENNSVVEDGYLAIYELEGGQAIRLMKVSDKPIKEILHYENMIVTIAHDYVVNFWDDSSYELLHKFTLLNGQELNELHSGNIADVYFDYFHSRLAILFDRVIRIYE